MAEPQDQAIRDLTRMSPALGRPAMPKTEAFLSAQRPEIPGYISEQQISPVMQELRGAEEAARTRAGEAEVDIEAAKRAERGREAQMKGELVQRQARETATLPERQQLMAKRQEFANAAFAPTRDNAEDLAKLFSLIGVLGVAIGGRGRGAGLQAMTAMNGMLEGYRRGRGDLYKQQLGEFDRSLKAMQQQIATLEKQYAEAVKLKALDREAGELEIQRVLAQSDSPVLKAMRARQGDLAALSYVQNMAKDVGTAVTLRNQLQTAADQRQDRVEAARQQREFAQEQQRRQQQFQAGMQASQQAFQQSMLDQRLAAASELADKKAAGAAQKIPMQVSAQNTLRNNLIPKIEEALPVLDRLQKEGKWTKLTSLLAVDSRLAEAAFTNDKEALNLILTLAYFRSKEFETAGKALTRKEDQILAPIVRGDLRTYQGIKNAMEVGLKTLKQEQGGLEAVYPSLKVYNDVFRQQLGTTGTPSFASEAEAQAAFDRGEIQAGAKIKIGNQTGTWQPK